MKSCSYRRLTRSQALSHSSCLFQPPTVVFSDHSHFLLPAPTNPSSISASSFLDTLVTTLHARAFATPSVSIPCAHFPSPMGVCLRAHLKIQSEDQNGTTTSTKLPQLPSLPPLHEVPPVVGAAHVPTVAVVSLFKTRPPASASSILSRCPALGFPLPTAPTSPLNSLASSSRPSNPPRRSTRLSHAPSSSSLRAASPLAAPPSSPTPSASSSAASWSLTKKPLTLLPNSNGPTLPGAPHASSRPRQLATPPPSPIPLTRPIPSPTTVPMPPLQCRKYRCIDNGCAAH